MVIGTDGIGRYKLPYDHDHPSYNMTMVYTGNATIVITDRNFISR